MEQPKNDDANLGNFDDESSDESRPPSASVSTLQNGMPASFEGSCSDNIELFTRSSPSMPPP